jgi:LmbE family N-acetylglucosaminyl deacetylase
VLRIDRVALFDYPDGATDDQPWALLTGHVTALLEELHAKLLLALDIGGITGHPDHRRATQAALAAAKQADRPVLAWDLRDDREQSEARIRGALCGAAI